MGTYRKIEQYKESTFEMFDKKISYRIYGNDQPKVLFLHGAGKATQDLLVNLANELSQLRISSVTFDFPGHGKSTGNILDSSLEERYLIANEVVKRTGANESVIAFSMSGQIAINLSNIHNIKNLVLCAPAIYCDSVFTIPFGNQNFSDSIRTGQSYLDSPTTQNNLENFAGNVYLVTSDNDAVIPDGVLDIIRRKSKNFEEIIILNSDHRLGHRFSQNPAEAKSLINRIFS